MWDGCGGGGGGGLHWKGSAYCIAYRGSLCHQLGGARHPYDMSDPPFLLSAGEKDLRLN